MLQGLIEWQVAKIEGLFFATFSVLKKKRTEILSFSVSRPKDKAIKLQPSLAMSMRELTDL